MKFEYEKTEFTYFLHYFFYNIKQSLSFISIIALVVLVENISTMEKISDSVNKNLLSIVLVTLGLILIDAIMANRIVQDDKKKTGGLYGKYTLFINKNDITLRYGEDEKVIPYEDIKKITISKEMILINFGDKDINITMAKMFFKTTKDFKTIKNMLIKNNSKNVRKRLFD